MCRSVPPYAVLRLNITPAMPNANNANAVGSGTAHVPVCQFDATGLKDASPK